MIVSQNANNSIISQLALIVSPSQRTLTVTSLTAALCSFIRYLPKLFPKTLRTNFNRSGNGMHTTHTLIECYPHVIEKTGKIIKSSKIPSFLITRAIGEKHSVYIRTFEIEYRICYPAPSNQNVRHTTP